MARSARPQSSSGSSGRTFAPQRSTEPRRVRGGMRLSDRSGEVRTGIVADAWLALVKPAFDDAVLREGLEFARSGQTVSLDVHPGRLAGRVQDAAPRPQQVSITIGELDDASWQAALQHMAAEAMFVVKLTADEFPPGTFELFAGLGSPLLPRDAAALQMHCDCGASMPCRHLATVCWLLADRLAQHPLLLFTLRGLEPELAIERLRQARVIRTQGRATAHPEPPISQVDAQTSPLETCIEDFWRCGPRIHELEQCEPPHHAPLALLRRLGPSTLHGRFPLVGLLASVYETVSKAAHTLRDRAEHLDESE